MGWPLWRVAVAERSMEPALLPGDWLLVMRRIRAGGAVPRIRPRPLVPPRRPGQPGLLLVKRAARRQPDGCWLESENPEAGAVDSRAFGVVPGGLIEGRVPRRYWPPPRPGGSPRRRAVG